MDGHLKVVCPCCKSDKIDIEKSFLIDNMDWIYSLTCADCGHEGYYTQKQMRFKRA